MTYMILIRDWHPARLNQIMRGHWLNGHRLKKADAQNVGIEFRMASIPPATCKRRVSLRIVLAKGQRKADPDAYWKSLLDALKQCGAIKEDTDNWCEVDGKVKFERGERKMTVITLEDIE